MIQVSELFKQVANEDGRTFRAKAIINEKVYTEFREVRITQSCESNTSLSFGSTPSTTLNITIVNVEKGSLLSGQKINLFVGLKTDRDLDKFEDNSAYTYIQLGIFNIDSLTWEDNDASIVAYDNFYLCEQGFFTNLSGMQKVKNIVSEQCIKLGIEFVDDIEDVSYNINVLKGLTIREAFGYLASFLGKNAVFNNLGKLQFIWYTYSGVTIEADRFSSPLTVGNPYTIESLNCTVRTTTIADDGITTTEDVTYSSGSGEGISFSNLYMTQERLNTLFARIQNTSVRNAQLNWTIALPYITVGDIIKIKDTDNAIYSIMVMEYTIDFDGGCYGTVDSKFISQSEQSMDFQGSLSQQVSRIYTDYGSFKEILAEKISASNVRFTQIETNYINVTGQLNAVKGKIEDLDVSNLSARVATIEQAYISQAQVEQLYATKAEVGSISANVADIQLALIGVAYIDDLNALDAKINEIEAGSITTDYLETNYAKINLSNIENGCITTAMIGDGVIGTVQIADGSITDAKIVGLTANKITAGTIDASDIEVINLNCANLTVGTINGQQIANNAIDWDKLSSQVSGSITEAGDNANQALEDALEAFQKAQEALNSANNAQTTANGKNTVFYQSTQPAVSGRKVSDIWYDTDDGYKMYYFNGTSWQAVEFGENAIADDAISADKIASDVNSKINDAFTNAGIAISDSSNALSKANTAIADSATALSTANSAKSTADGKNSVFYQTNAPSTSNRKVNDVWFDTDDSNKMYYWNGSAWTARQFGTNAIANLAITNALIANGTIQNAKIANLDAAKITSGYINVARLQAGSITADKLKTDTITAASGVIADAAILTANIADLAVSSGKIANAAIGTAKIADLAVTNAKLADLSVTNAKIADATIQSAKIASLDAGKITSGYISSDRIQAGSLAIGKLDNGTQAKINNAEKQYRYTVDLTASTYDVDTYYPVRLNSSVPINGVYGKYQCNVVLNSGSKPSWSTHNGGFTCNLIAYIKYSGWGATDGSGWIEENYYGFCDKMPAYIQQLAYTSKVVFYLRGGGRYYIISPNETTFTIYTTKTNTNNSSYPQYVEPTKNPKNGFTIMEPNIIGSWCYSNDTTYINGGKIYTGTVTALQIAANAIVAGKIAANAVTTGTIAADAVTSAKIAADAITAEHVAANAITTDNIVAGAVTGAKIAASTITANNIAANTITAAKIASGTITATQIASGTITATQLASNSVTAVKIAANAITSDKISANAITSAKIATDAIKSRNYVANSAGSYLNLQDGSFTSKNLKWTSNGTITATNGSFSGTITANSGAIGGWKLSDTFIYNDYDINSTTRNRMYLDSSRNAFGVRKEVLSNGVWKETTTVEYTYIGLGISNGDGTSKYTKVFLSEDMLSFTVDKDKNYSCNYTEKGIEVYGQKEYASFKYNNGKRGFAIDYSLNVGEDVAANRFLLNVNGTNRTLLWADSSNDWATRLNSGNKGNGIIIHGSTFHDANIYINAPNNNPVVQFNTSDSQMLGRVYFDSNGLMKCRTEKDVNTIKYIVASTNLKEISYIYNSGNRYVQFMSGANLYGVDVWVSDRRLKRNILDSKVNALEKLMRIRHCSYILNDGNFLVENGYIADELEIIDKNFVFQVGDYKQPSVQHLIPLLSKSIQEQQLIINGLISEINKLNAKLDAFINGNFEIREVTA